MPDDGQKQSLVGGDGSAMAQSMNTVRLFDAAFEYLKQLPGGFQSSCDIFTLGFFCFNTLQGVVPQPQRPKGLVGSGTLLKPANMCGIRVLFVLSRLHMQLSHSDSAAQRWQHSHTLHHTLTDQCCKRAVLQLKSGIHIQFKSRTC